MPSHLNTLFLTALVSQEGPPCDGVLALKKELTPLKGKVSQKRANTMTADQLLTLSAFIVQLRLRTLPQRDLCGTIYTV